MTDLKTKSGLGRFNLRWLAVGATLTSGLFLGWRFAPEPLAQHMFAQMANVEGAPFAARLVGALDARSDTFVARQVTPSDKEALLVVAATEEIYKLILRDKSGKAFWSNRASEIGNTVPTSLLSKAMQSGQSHFEHIHAPQSDVTGIDTSTLSVDAKDHDGRDISHHVLPVLADGNLVGYIEMYTDVTAINNAFIATIRGIFAALGGLIGGVGLAVALRIRHAGVEKLVATKEHAEAKHSFLSEQLRLGREVKLLGELNEWLQSSKSLDELFYMVTRFMTHLLPSSAGSIYVYSNSRDVLDGASSWNGGCHRAHIHPEDCWGLRRGRTYSFAEGEVQFRCGHMHEEEVTNYICIPFLAHGETVGLMHLEAHPNVTSEDFAMQKKLAQMCAEQISLAIANVRMRDELHHQAIRDVLTGLFNRRHLMDTLRRRIETRRADPFSIISIDVDYFKKFNDNYGHDAGDLVLRSIGEAMNTSVNGSEIACRMGGEELMILLPDVTLETAMARADALRLTIAALKVRYAERICRRSPSLSACRNSRCTGPPRKT